MTIRRALDEMLSAEVDGDSGDPGPSTVRGALDAAGFGEVPAELVGTAVGHYADSAAIEQADMLAPLATDASSVPFDAELDVPGDDVDTHDLDPMDAVDAVDTTHDELSAESPDESAGEMDADPDPHADPDPGGATDFGTGSVGASLTVLDEAEDPMASLDARVSDTGAPDSFGSSIDDALRTDEMLGVDEMLGLDAGTGHDDPADAFDTPDESAGATDFDLEEGDVGEDGTDVDFDGFDIG